MKDPSPTAAFQFWNRIGIVSFVFAPILFIAAGLTSDRALEIFFALSGVSSALTTVFAYARIRSFRCPRCGDQFTVKYPLGPNSTGRRCVHCGLEAWPSE